MVLEDVFELHDVLMMERLVYFNFADELRITISRTFCFALLLFSDALVMILAARTFLFSRLVIS